MNRSSRSSAVACSYLLAAVTLVLTQSASANVTLPSVIGSHMVLQRDMPLTIWGWADPGEDVTVSIGDSRASAKADAKGNWRVKLPAMKAGGPCEMTVSGKNTVKLTDILIGEVWVCSGQSNMEMGMKMIQNAPKEVGAANRPNIRLFQVMGHTTSGYPESNVRGAWKRSTPASVSEGDYGGFSAAGFFFGRTLHKELGVPVGLIDTSWGGTRIEPWTPPEGFAAVPKLAVVSRQIVQTTRVHKQAIGKTLGLIEAYLPLAKQALAGGKRVPRPPAWPRHYLDNGGRPTGIYNAMVHGMVPFAIRGAIWYQGESNRGEGMLYFEKMKALILGWRKIWGQGELPFIFVQLAPFRYGDRPYELCKIWEAQTAALTIPNTGMAVTTDLVHNIKDIHPINKQDVGKRLALWALAKTYGREGLVYSGPLYKSMKADGNTIHLTFDHVGGGLASRDGKSLTHFQIADADKKFVNAEAKIDGATVVLCGPDVAKPVAVRFGWHQEAMPNLTNKEGLPASPFRTDRW